MDGHSQRTLISYLEMLSVTQLGGQEPALTQTTSASFNRHAFMSRPFVRSQFKIVGFFTP